MVAFAWWADERERTRGSALGLFLDHAVCWDYGNRRSVEAMYALVTQPMLGLFLPARRLRPRDARSEALLHCVSPRIALSSCLHVFVVGIPLDGRFFDDRARDSSSMLLPLLMFSWSEPGPGAS